MSINQRQHFNKLYQGTSEVIHELCTEGAYQEGTYVFYYGNRLRALPLSLCLCLSLSHSPLLYLWASSFWHLIVTVRITKIIPVQLEIRGWTEFNSTGEHLNTHAQLNNIKIVVGHFISIHVNLILLTRINDLIGTRELFPFNSIVNLLRSL